MKAKDKKQEKQKRREAEYHPLDVEGESKRLNRVIGQIEGIRKMLDDRRKLDAVLTQCKAVHSALKSVELRILKAHLDAALADIEKGGKKKDRAERIESLRELYECYDA